MPEGFREPSQALNKKLVIISALLAALALLAYFVFYFLSEHSRSRIDVLRQDIAIEEQKIQAAKVISENLNLDQLSVFKNLLDNHVYWSQVFPEIERLTLPKISFSEFKGHINDNDKEVILDLSGSSRNFNELAQQVLAFRSSNIFKQVDFSTSGAQKEGGIGMGLKLKLDINEIRR